MRAWFDCSYSVCWRPTARKFISVPATSVFVAATKLRSSPPPTTPPRFYLMLFCLVPFGETCFYHEAEGPIFADPITQDNGKKNIMQVHTQRFCTWWMPSLPITPKDLSESDFWILILGPNWPQNGETMENSVSHSVPGHVNHELCRRFVGGGPLQLGLQVSDSITQV